MQRYFAKDKIDNEIILSSDDVHHVKRVMRMNVNDKIEAVYDNILYLCNIDDINELKVSIDKEIEQVDDKYPYIRLVIPSLKEQKMDLIIQKATEIGVAEFVVAPFERSIVKYDERKEKVKLERWNKIAKEASEQSMRIDIPLITIEKDMKFIKSLDGIKCICSTNERSNYIKYILKNKGKCDKITLVIGPEGGISPREEEMLEEMGCKKITLGSQIMRVETVPIFLASVIRYEFTE